MPGRRKTRAFGHDEKPLLVEYKGIEVVAVD